MEGRNQFTFYRSFADALKRIRKKADRCDAYDAICNYAIYGIEPDMDSLADAAALAFDLIRPNLDSAKKKSDGGKKTKTSDEDTGKIPGRCAEDNSKIRGRYAQQEKEQVKEKEKEQVKGKEQMLIPPTPFTDENRATVIRDYLNRVNPSASSRSLEELGGYADTLGADVCIRAIDVALDAKAANWNYIRAILRRLQGQGVKCLADWDAEEQKRDAGKSAQPNGAQSGKKTVDFVPGAEEMDAIRKLRDLREAIRKEGEAADDDGA